MKEPVDCRLSTPAGFSGTVPPPGRTKAARPGTIPVRRSRGSASALPGKIYGWSRRQRDRFAMLLSSFDAALAAYSGVVVSRGTRSLPPSLRLFRAMTRKWLSVTARGNGVEFAIASAKEFSAACRAGWISGTVPDHFFMKWLPEPVRRKSGLWAQLSFIGRSLPEGGDRHEIEALANHKAALSSSFEVPADVLTSLRNYSEDWARRHLAADPDPSLLCEPCTGNSATFERTRREGGFAQSITDLVSSSPTDNLPPLESMPFGPTQGQALPVHVLEVSLSRYHNGSDPKGRVSVVRERGHKVRVVSAMETHELVLGHAARRRLFKGLRRERRLRDTLKGDFEATTKAFVGCAGTVISSDMKSASDLIPLSVASAIVDGLEASGRLLPVEIAGLRACTGPQHLVYPDGSEITTRRGILMGLPTTWAILNLMHLWCWDSADRQYRLEGHPFRATVRSDCRVCGDDLIGVGPDSLLRSYDRNLGLVGMILSPGKHFRSNRRGVFLERLLEFQTRKTVYEHAVIYRKVGHRRVPVDRSHIPVVTRVTVLNTIPLKGLVRASVLGRDDPPVWWAAAVAESSLLSDYPRKKIFAAARTLRPGLSRQFRRLGIPPFLPRELGGAGLVGPSDRVDAPAFHRKAISSLVWGSDATAAYSFIRMWQGFEGHPWKTAASQETDTWFADYKVTRPGKMYPDRYGFLDGESLRTKSTMLNSAVYETFLGPDPDATHYPSLRIVASRLAKVRKDLVNRWPSVKPVGKDLGTILEAFEESKLCTLWVTPYDASGYFDDSLLLMDESVYQRRFRQLVIAGLMREGRMGDLLFPNWLPPSTVVSGFP
ncbi:RNA-dependent RNA polymerase [Saccharomyces 20S RNA narnavirus]|uniref:RNA-directed RNA polymerase n=1 Tax=Saccharomyces 20S RNA narnavirus TaxID=186772 RepID=RDRP_SCV20|nr:RNA-dependent RNA polymerase [Saccharomyces 20S RNA narnavirus]P25328.1 RecName: Full=RNA-directed RNA polymerase; AltName: Full=p91 [Saccharomyces 20S RNA narnavirus]AAC98925.1 RNA-dependent RNA polymerase [Saccharomyces 20S RNA narnavirus]